MRVPLRPWLAPTVGVIALVVLVALVSVHHGSVALDVDRPVTHWAVDERSSGWTAFFRGITNLGNPGLAFAGGLLLAVLAVFRSPFTALLLLLVALVRPLTSTVFKDVLDRARPGVPHLVTASGTSFPSGHVLAAVVFWGAVPVTMLVWSAARGFVRAALAFAVLAAFLVACSRVYLGVHWLSDVIGGALIGTLLLTPVYRLRAVPRLTT